MSVKRKIIFLILLSISIVLIVSIVWYNSLPDLSLNLRDSRFSISSYEANGTLYFIRSDGVYKTEDGKAVNHIIEKECNEASFYISKTEQTIYVIEDGILNQYDFNGNYKYNPIVLPEDFQFYKADDNVLIGRNERIDTSKIVEYDIEKNLQGITIDAVKYDNAQASFCIMEDEILNHSFKSMQSKLIGISGYHIAYVDKFYHPEINVINCKDSTEKTIKLYNYNQKGYYTFGFFNGNTISAITTNTSGFLFDKINVTGNTSTLKYHNYDSYIVFDSESGEVKYQHNFSRFERVIYVDDKKAITYSKGTYLTYSLDDFKVIDSKVAAEIKSGGSYTFEICGDYIFVFDDNSGELLNRISVID